MKHAQINARNVFPVLLTSASLVIFAGLAGCSKKVPVADGAAAALTQGQAGQAQDLAQLEALKLEAMKKDGTTGQASGAGNRGVANAGSAAATAPAKKGLFATLVGRFMGSPASTSDANQGGRAYDAGSAGTPPSGNGVATPGGQASLPVLSGKAYGTTAADVAAEPAKVVEAPKTCVTLTFHHKALKSHSSDEDCSHHRNLVKLPVAMKELNAKSVCVRVEGKPVSFQLAKNGVLIGPVAGPKTKVTARYCFGKNGCSEDCTVAKDEFMDAIGGEDEVSGKAKVVAQWDPNDKDADRDVSAELDGEIQKELSGGSDLGMFEDWVSDTEVPATACVAGTKMAQKN